MKYSECNLDVSLKRNIIKCLSEAVGNDVRACLQSENIDERKSNGRSFLKWDFINRNFIRCFYESQLTAKYAKRGGWNMVPLFHRETGTLFTVMREDRFAEIQKKQPTRRKAHYMDALVMSFNEDITNAKQMTLFDNNRFPDEEVSYIVEGILRNFEMDNVLVSRYATILFSEYNSEVTSVRCCVLDSSLQIVDEENWSEYINYNESVVVEVMDIDIEETEMPRINLTEKARKRIGQRELVSLKDEKSDDECKENI